MVNEFNIERLEGRGITARVVDNGQLYTTYRAFAKAADYPDAAGWGKDAVELTGEDVCILARGAHECDGDSIYVIETTKGERFLIGEAGLTINITEKVLQPKTLIEQAQTVFKRTGDSYIAHKTRENDLVRDGQYSDNFVKHYATVTQDVLIID